MNIDTSAETNQQQQQQLRQRLDDLATMLDSAIRIPGTQIRFGADALIGLIPGVGDLLGLALGLWLIWQARGVKAPGRLQLKMLGNLAIEAVIGVVPLLGDLFDVLWQANQRNRKVLIDWMDEQAQTEDLPKRRGWIIWLALGITVIATVIWVAQG